MKRIIIDTNVLVSVLIQRGFPYLIIYELFIENRIQLCISAPLMQEYYDVLRRQKFARFRDFFAKTESLLADIESKAMMFSPQVNIDLIFDKDDNMLLELVDECQADFIITGNTTDFTFSFYKHTRIVSPKEYWESFV
jgi:putative PIN family toxin of toxin-antitoxin system